MVLKNVFIAVICATLLRMERSCRSPTSTAPTSSSASIFRRAVLSPKPLGPPAEFVPVPVEAKDRPRRRGAGGGSAQSANQRSLSHEPDARSTRSRVAHPRAEKPRVAARTELAHRHGNPLDAQALDTRIQVLAVQVGRHLRLEA